MVQVKFSIPTADHNSELQHLLDWFTDVSAAHDTTVKFLLTYVNIYRKPDSRILFPFDTPQDVFILSSRNLLFLETVKAPESSIPILLLPCADSASRRAITHIRSSFYDMRPSALQAHNLPPVTRPVSDRELSQIKSMKSVPYLPWITRDTPPVAPQSLSIHSGNTAQDQFDPEALVSPTMCSPGDLIWIEDMVDRGEYHGVTAGPVLCDVNDPGKQWLLTVGHAALPRPPQVLSADNVLNAEHTNAKSPSPGDNVGRGVSKFAENDRLCAHALCRYEINCHAEDLARSQMRSGIKKPGCEQFFATCFAEWVRLGSSIAPRAEVCRIGTCRLAENVLAVSDKPIEGQDRPENISLRTASDQKNPLSSSADPLCAIDWALIELSEDFGTPANTYLGPHIRKPEAGMPVRLAREMGTDGKPKKYAQGAISRAPAYQVDVYPGHGDEVAEVVKVVHPFTVISDDVPQETLEFVTELVWIPEADINREFAEGQHAGSAIYSLEGGDVVGYVTGGIDFDSAFSFGPITLAADMETVLRRIERFRGVPHGSMVLADKRNL